MAQCLRHGWDAVLHGRPCPSCTDPIPAPPKRKPGALTSREVEMLDYLSERAARGEMPLYREIAEHFGISREVAEGHMKALRGKGYTTGGPGTYRRLRLSARAKREIAEVGELRARNDQLESQVKALEGAVARMENILKEKAE